MYLEMIREIANKYILNQSKLMGIELIILDDETIIEDDFVVFRYTSKRFMEEDDIRYAIAGNGPIFITKKDGKIYEAGTAQSIDYYIENFKKYGNPYPPEDVIKKEQEEDQKLLDEIFSREDK